VDLLAIPDLMTDISIDSDCGRCHIRISAMCTLLCNAQ
jgi:hypothetical protein